MVRKQTIQLEFQDTPTGTPLAGCSVTPLLDCRESDWSATETMEGSIEAGLCHAEVDQRDAQPEQLRKVAVESAHVFVLDANGTPLMPCKPRKARKLLEGRKAVVVMTCPFFVIKLTKHVGGKTQPITLGLDEGYGFVGFALVGIYCYLLGQVKLDNMMSKRLEKRAKFRRSRRGRKCRYRPARWKNRASHRNKDLPPSVQRRINRHFWVIDKLRSICPITEIRTEGASFDIQKLENPEIQGIGYQQGKLFRTNMRNFLFARENGICQYCGKKINVGERIEMHHIIHRAKGGTDKPDNMALLHEKCHHKMHTRNDFAKLKKNKQYKAESFMNVLRKRLRERYPDAVETFGYITQVKRNELGLPKTHYNDAFVIAGGTTQLLPNPLKLEEHRKNNRSLQKQRKGSEVNVKQQKRYPIQSGDLVWIGKKRYVSKGSNSYGKQIWIIKDEKKVRISTSKITKVFHTGTITFES